jgi:hypothetical protein
MRMALQLYLVALHRASEEQQALANSYFMAWSKRWTMANISALALKRIHGVKKSQSGRLETELSIPLNGIVGDSELWTNHRFSLEAKCGI